MKKAMLMLSMLGAAGTSHAGFITIDNVNPGGTTIGVALNNDFAADLAAAGVTTYTLGTSLGLDQAGSVTFYYYGKEAGYNNEFTAGSLSYETSTLPTAQNLFGSRLELGTIAAGPGLLDLTFCAFSGSNPQGCVSNAQNDGLGLFSAQSIAISIISSGAAWLFWDDSGAGPDDNHDDMLIKAVFTPPTSVPEPGTLALFGVGLLGLGLAKRAKRKS